MYFHSDPVDYALNSLDSVEEIRWHTELDFWELFVALGNSLEDHNACCVWWLQVDHSLTLGAIYFAFSVSLKLQPYTNPQYFCTSSICFQQYRKQVLETFLSLRGKVPDNSSAT